MEIPMAPRKLLIVLLALALPSAYANTTCNETCQNLLRDGQVSMAKEKYSEALDKFMKAASVAPQSSLPLSLLSSLLERMSTKVEPPQAEKLRKQAEGAARAALDLNADDPVAQKTLRLLANEGPPAAL
jgi:tetratricopeptide (TPR) repeat protein